MDYFAWLYLAILGAFMGSFAHSLVQRMSLNQSLFPRSYCLNCRKRLKFYHLIPFVSFIWLKGRCSYCRAPIALSYVFYEFFFSLLSLLIWWRVTNIWLFGFWYFVWFCLLVNMVLDYKHQWLSAYLLLWPMVLGLCWLALPFVSDPRPHLIGLVLGPGFLHLLDFSYTSLRNRPGLGSGDITLSGVLGLLLGWQAVFPILILSSVTASLFILFRTAWYYTTKRKNLSQPSVQLTDSLAFAPYLILVAFFYWLVDCGQFWLPLFETFKSA